MTGRTRKRAEERVLIVDEHRGSRQVFVKTFQMRGHAAAGAATAAEALELVDEFEPTVVILEWVFRDKSGIGLARRLRARARRSLIVIAVSTANEPAKLREQEGFDDYFEKPCSVDTLEAAIARLRRNHKG